MSVEARLILLDPYGVAHTVRQVVLAQPVPTYYEALMPPFSLLEGDIPPTLPKIKHRAFHRALKPNEDGSWDYIAQWV